MKGKILDYNIQESKGVISGDDGQRYSFENKDWKASELPKVNQVVDFETDELNAKNIYAQTVQQSNSNSADGKNITFPLISLVSSIVGIFFGLFAIVGILVTYILYDYSTLFYNLLRVNIKYIEIPTLTIFILAICLVVVGFKDKK